MRADVITHAVDPAGLRILRNDEDDGDPAIRARAVDEMNAPCGRRVAPVPAIVGEELIRRIATLEEPMLTRRFGDEGDVDV